MAKFQVDKALLEKLYWKDNLSPYKIGNILGCTFGTVRNRLKEHGIKLKSPAFARMRYKKVDFDGDLLARAYMLGFRLGDLNVYSPSVNSETIVARCHTTQIEQVEVIKSLFVKYGHTNVSNNIFGHFQITSYLNNSFRFLLGKKFNPKSFVQSKKSALAFIAGYVDAEGSFTLNQNRARFKIDAYDYDILNWTSIWLTRDGITNKFKCISRQGEAAYKMRYKWNKDLWRININDARMLEKFALMLLPYLRHKIRIKDIGTCLANIKTRRQNGTIR